MGGYNFKMLLQCQNLSHYFRVGVLFFKISVVGCRPSSLILFQYISLSFMKMITANFAESMPGHACFINNNNINNNNNNTTAETPHIKT